MKVYNSKQKKWVEEIWQNVRAGSIVQVMRDEFTPCDICVIYSPEKENSLYVETKNLDGETNLKNRRAPKELDQDENLYQNF